MADQEVKGKLFPIEETNPNSNTVYIAPVKSTGQKMENADSKKKISPEQKQEFKKVHETLRETKEKFIGSRAQYMTDWTRDKKIELIEIKIRKVNQLFNSFDPSPFLEKDLDEDAFEYIVSSVGEYPIHTKQKILIYLPKHENKKVSEIDIIRAIHNFFIYKTLLADKSIKLKLQEGQLSLFVGVIFLGACLFIRNLISSLTGVLMSMLAEGLIIGGWVAMWKPISNILYDWWPLHKERRIFEKISKMEIEFVWLD